MNVGQVERLMGEDYGFVERNRKFYLGKKEVAKIEITHGRTILGIKGSQNWYDQWRSIGPDEFLEEANPKWIRERLIKAGVLQ